MNKVFFHEHLLTFDAAHFSGSLKVKVADEAKLREFVFRWLQEERRKDALLYGYDVKEMKKDFRRIFHFVEAAGGVVRDKKHRVLFIKRWNRWDLPKGKKEKKETMSQCALREVEEETGVKNLNIIRSLSSSYHLFETRDQWFMKKTYWFLMETTYEGETKPQNEEDITAVQWMNEDQCSGALASTYRSLRDALKMEICTLFEEKTGS